MRPIEYWIPRLKQSTLAWLATIVLSLPVGPALAQTLKLVPEFVTPDSVKFTIQGGAVGSDVTWSVDPDQKKSKCEKIKTDICKGVYTVPNGFRGKVTVMATAAGSTIAPKTVSVSNDVEDWEARAVVGLQQAGAANAEANQNWFLDFFIMRGLQTKNEHLWETGFNVWGNVRIASEAQQISAPISDFLSVQELATQFGKVPVNKLAQGAEFQFGLEKKIYTFGRGGKRRRMLGFIAYYGASGIFQEPAQRIRVFKTPKEGEPQFPQFQGQFPDAAKSQKEFIGFVPFDKDQFNRMYGAGLRLTTFNADEPRDAPGTVYFAVGQDEVVTGGRFKGAVGRFDALYPLPFNGNFVYLFGTANLKLFGRQIRTPLVLEELDTTPGAANRIDRFSPKIFIQPVESNRDTYRVGFGIDLVRLIGAIPKGNK